MPDNESRSRESGKPRRKGKMKTLAELQEEYRAEEDAFKKLEAEHFEKKARIKADIMEYARYAPGDKVWYLEGRFTNEEPKRTPGKIRVVFAGKALCGNKIIPLYTVGKITKSGAIHANHNLGWRGLQEEDIEPREVDQA